ncbi:MAG: hypothetical protein HDS66_08435 [Bacteroidales bacterium]|nr:hypothetical protein [Bacteroidales bacterium]
MNRTILCYVCSIFCLLVSSCTSGDSKAKEAVKLFCEAYNAGQTDKAHGIYPAFTAGEAKTAQVDIANLKATRQNDIWKVEDGAKHVFFVEEVDGKFIIKDSQNVIEWKSKVEGDVVAAKIFGMVNEKSSDIERIEAYSMLQDGSDFIEFLKKKYPQALVYDVTVENVQKNIEGGYGLYVMEVKATLKSGPTEPMPLRVIFVVKDKDGNEIGRQRDVPVSLDANSTKVVTDVIDLADYPNTKNVSVELLPWGDEKRASIIDLLCAYAPLKKQDYQEFLNTRK